MDRLDAEDTEVVVRHGARSGRSVSVNVNPTFSAAATDSNDLESVYEEIDSLERIERRLPPRVRHTERPEPLLALAIGFALVEIASTRVFRRRTP